MADGTNEIQVSANWFDLEDRVKRLRSKATNVLSKTKELLEQTAKDSGLPVTFSLTCKIIFPEEQNKEDDSKKSKKK